MEKINVCVKKLHLVVKKLPISNITSQFTLLGYQVTIHGIFIERLLNEEWQLTKDNITKEEDTMNCILSFFYEWRNEVLLSNQEANIAARVREKYSIARKAITF